MASKRRIILVPTRWRQALTMPCPNGIHRCELGGELFNTNLANTIYVTGGLHDSSGKSLAQIYADSIKHYILTHDTAQKLQDDSIVIDDASHNLAHDIKRFAEYAFDENIEKAYIISSPEQMKRTVQVFQRWNTVTEIVPCPTKHREGIKVAIEEWILRWYTERDPEWKGEIINWLNRRRIKQFAQHY